VSFLEALFADTETLLAVMGVILVMGIVQGSVAFAGGLIGIPLLSMAGLTLPEAVAVSIFCGIPQNLTGCWQLRKEIPWGRTLRPIAIRTLFLPLGILALHSLDETLRWTIDPAVGAVMLGLLGLLLFVHPEHKPEFPVKWEVLACSVSGFLVGFCGMGGPALVVWTLAHDWSATKTRGFLFAVYAANLLPQLGIYAVVWGPDLARAFAFGALGVPLSSAGMLLGLYVSRWISKKTLRRIAYGTILVTALLSIAQPFVARLRQDGDTPAEASGSDEGALPAEAASNQR
jgi:uncharacterized membrane protein YfcA